MNAAGVKAPIANSVSFNASINHEKVAGVVKQGHVSMGTLHQDEDTERCA